MQNICHGFTRTPGTQCASVLQVVSVCAVVCMEHGTVCPGPHSVCLSVCLSVNPFSSYATAYIPLHYIMLPGPRGRHAMNKQTITWMHAQKFESHSVHTLHCRFWHPISHLASHSIECTCVGILFEHCDGSCWLLTCCNVLFCLTLGSTPSTMWFSLSVVAMCLSATCVTVCCSLCWRNWCSCTAHAHGQTQRANPAGSYGWTVSCLLLVLSFCPVNHHHQAFYYR